MNTTTVELPSNNMSEEEKVEEPADETLALAAKLHDEYAPCAFCGKRHRRRQAWQQSACLSCFQLRSSLGPYWRRRSAMGK